MGKEKEITTAIFIPASRGSQLFNLIQQKEDMLVGQLSWGVKVLKMLGTPIASMLMKKFPLEGGCPLGENCKACKGDGIKCSAKGVVYQATCLDCSPENEDEGRGVVHKYIGETSRLMRTRMFEHMSALGRLNKKSFQVQHWMESHSLSSYPADFKFEIIQSFKDPLSRQLCEALEIVNSGNLNQKTEFKLNDLCRLVSDRTDREKEEEVETARLERNILDQHLNSFINVIKDVEEKEKKDQEMKLILPIFSDLNKQEREERKGAVWQREKRERERG